MTAPNPEQLRVRADRLEASARGVPESDTYAQALVFNALLAADNIRAAADQLEAVRRFADQADLVWNVNPRVSDRLKAILTANVAESNSEAHD